MERSDLELVLAVRERRSLWDVAPQLKTGNWFACCRNTPCRMLTCIGWPRTGHRRPSAFGCWLIFWWSALKTNPGKSHRPLRRPHDQAHTDSGDQRAGNGHGGDRLRKQNPRHQRGAGRHQVHQAGH